MALLEVNDLKTYFRTDDGIVKAVDGVTFAVEKGKTLGIVGESGCGKSVTCLTIMGLNNRRNTVTSGQALYYICAIHPWMLGAINAPAPR